MTDHDPLLYPRHYPLTRQTNRFCNTKIHLACTITSVSDSCRYGGRRIYLSSWSPPLEGRSCAFLRGVCMSLLSLWTVADLSRVMSFIA